MGHPCFYASFCVLLAVPRLVQGDGLACGSTPAVDYG
jgi:hypothetical protein